MIGNIRRWLVCLELYTGFAQYTFHRSSSENCYFRYSKLNFIIIPLCYKELTAKKKDSKQKKTLNFILDALNYVTVVIPENNLRRFQISENSRYLDTFTQRHLVSLLNF